MNLKDVSINYIIFQKKSCNVKMVKRRISLKKKIKIRIKMPVKAPYHEFRGK